MADVIGRGVIEVSADSSKLKAGIDDAKRSIRSFGQDVANSVGTASEKASRSIDNYVKKLQDAAATNGKSTREIELYKLALRGASEAQLGAASNALKMAEAYEKGVAIGEKVKTGLIAIAAAAAVAGVAAYVAFGKITESIAKYQELSEKTGETASNIQALQQASNLSGVSLDTVATASIKLTASLSKTDDESKLVAKGIKALGLNFEEFKKLSPKGQLESVATAMSSFADGSEKAATAVAIFGKTGAELLPFLNDLAESGETQIRLTDEQIKLADDYSKAQARVRGEIESIAQIIVANSIPAVTDLTGAFKDVIKEVLGLDGAAGDLKSNNGIQTFAEEGAHYLATLVDYAVKAGQAIHAVGDTIGAGLASNAALLKGDFTAAFNIAKDYYSKIGNTFDGPSVADALDKRIADRKSNAAQSRVENRGFDPSKKRIDASDLNTDKTPKGRKDNSAAQEAKAQLAFDLEDIKKAQEAITNAYANSEKILEAKRSANLVDEKEYYAEKKNLLDLNNQAQQDGLQKELDRLQQENLSGKDKINNDRKILDVQAQLTKARANAATASQVLGIQEQAAYKKIADAIEEARLAAQDYLDTTKRRFDRELSGLGKGDQNRERDALKNSTDDNFLGQRQSLARDLRRNQITQQQYDDELKIINEAHQKALALDDAYFEEKLKKQKDFGLGASEALKNYYDESQNVFKQTQEAVTNAFKGMEDALVSFATTGKADFKSLIDSILADVARMAIKQAITGPLANLVGGALGGGGSSGGGSDVLGAFISTLGARAIGGPVSPNSMYRVNEKGPELLNVAGKQYLMTGAQGGSVEANGGGGGGGVAVTIHQSFAEGTTRKTADQAALAASNAIRRAQRNA